MYKKTKKLLLLSISIGFIVALSSWGFLVHRTINQLAIYELPSPLNDFFYQHKQYLVYNSVRPDLRRNKDKTEATKHFVDLEAFEHDHSQMPVDENDAIKKYGEDSLKKYGYVPYYIITMMEKLTQAFKQRHVDSIIFFAADIGHYISDANVPLHTTLNYDGQLTNQKGIHALWESTIPEIELKSMDFYGKDQAKFLKTPEIQIWDAVRQAHALLPNFLAEEKQVSSRFTDDEKYNSSFRNGKEYKKYSGKFAKALYQSLKPTIENQIKASVSLVSDIWFTAWVNAGKPDLSKLTKENATIDYKKELKSDLEYYKTKQLIENDRLLSLQKNKSSDESE
ncbi:MAG: zinc dependent phospholipase C family protein [Alphaproteobacteria bacterium]|nr:zinc dependent phospholipase C family protein [Alphaproteobacteria bacterium]